LTEYRAYSIFNFRESLSSKCKKKHNEDVVTSANNGIASELKSLMAVAYGIKPIG